MQRSRHAGFAVLDVETTGLSPRADRIAEIAVVQLDRDLTPAGEFTTLVNPGQDTGRADAQGITAGDVADAPRFAEIAPTLLDVLRGRVIVAHNAPFDLRFLAAEFTRMGLPLPELPALCTMKLAPQYLPGLPARSLAACCAAAGVPLDGPGAAAEHDARAAAGLITCYARKSRKIPAEWILALGSASRLDWPAPVPTAAQPVPREDAPRRSGDDGFLARLARDLPRTGAGAAVESYLAALDTVLEDRQVTSTEAASLRDLARSLDIDPDAAAAAHQAYLGALAAAAWADRVVTDAEYADLADVARLLSLPDGTVDAELAAARTAAPAW